MAAGMTPIVDAGSAHRSDLNVAGTRTRGDIKAGETGNEGVRLHRLRPVTVPVFRRSAVTLVVIGAVAALGVTEAGAKSNACRHAGLTAKRDQAKLKIAIGKLHSDRIAGNTAALARDEKDLGRLELSVARDRARIEHVCR